MKVKEFKKCKNCGAEFKAFRSTDTACSWECANMLTEEREKRREKQKKKPTRIRHVSKNREARLAIYRKRRDNFLKLVPTCEVEGCKSKTSDLHHKAGRLGNNLIDEANFMGVCRPCHNWIHEHPKEAREKNYLK